MGSDLEERVDDLCPNCGESVSGWSDFLTEEVLYKQGVCDTCSYEVFVRLDYLTSGF